MDEGGSLRDGGGPLLLRLQCMDPDILALRFYHILHT